MNSLFSYIINHTKYSRDCLIYKILLSYVLEFKIYTVSIDSISTMKFTFYNIEFTRKGFPCNSSCPVLSRDPYRDIYRAPLPYYSLIWNKACSLFWSQTGYFWPKNYIISASMWCNFLVRTLGYQENPIFYLFST